MCGNGLSASLQVPNTSYYSLSALALGRETHVLVCTYTDGGLHPWHGTCRYSTHGHKKEKSKILKTPKTNHKWSIAPRLRRRAEWTRQLFLNTPPAPTPALARTNKTRIRPWNLVGRAKGAAPTTRFAQKQIHAETRPYVVTHIIFSPHDAHLGSSSLHDPADHQRSGPPLSSLLLLMFFLHLAARQPRLSRDHPFSPLFFAFLRVRRKTAHHPRFM